MITVNPHPTELLAMRATVDGLLVFLDNFAIKELAKGDPERRKRFLATLERGVEVMFSVSNAAELSGPQGSSFNEIRSFLDDIGNHWFPVEFDPYVCLQREQESQNPINCMFSESLLKRFVATRIRRAPEIKIEDLRLSLPSDFFRLGAFMDWLAPQRDDIKQRKADLGLRLRDQITEHWAEYKKNPTWLDTTFPQLPFNSARRATFVYVNLVRRLILEAKERTITLNDGVDFAQAVVATAYASIASVDKHWKRRVEMILPKPKPSTLAALYYQPELDKMVRDIESYLDNASLRRGRERCVRGCYSAEKQSRRLVVPSLAKTQ